MLIGIDGNEANVEKRVGSGQYAFELLHQFAKNKQHQFVVYVKANPLHGLPHQAANFRYQVFGPQKLWTQLALPIRLALGSGINVFFSMAHYGPRFSKIPYVVTIHDLSFLHYPSMFKKNDLYQLTSWTKYSVKKAAHIIAVSQTTKDDIVRNYHVDPAKITVTYEGYDEDRFKPQPKSRVALRRAQGDTERSRSIERVKMKYKIDGDYIIFVGTLQPRKNLERLIEAFSQILHQTTPGVGSPRRFTLKGSDSPGVKKDLRNPQLVIVGKKGWLYDSIFQKVKDLNLENQVIFTDFVPDTDLPALISGAKAYVLPSLWEGFGIPVIEAQACGVPVVVSNTSSLPEIISSKPVIPSEAKDLDSSTSSQNDKAIVSGSGILVNPESVDSIAAGIKKALDHKIRSDLVNKGYQNIKRFSWQNCAEETLEVLVKVASKQSPIV